MNMDEEKAMILEEELAAASTRFQDCRAQQIQARIDGLNRTDPQEYKRIKQRAEEALELLEKAQHAVEVQKTVDKGLTEEE